MDETEIAYILLRFPSVTETFVAEEIRRIIGLGRQVTIYSLLPPKPGPVHPVSAELQPVVRYAPALYAPALWLAQLKSMFRQPKTYFRLIRTLSIQRSFSISIYLKRLVIFLKSVWLAEVMRKRQIQSIHTHFAWLSAVSAAIISALIHRPYTLTTHAFDIYSSKSDLFHWTTDAADRLITISDYNKRAMLEKNPSLTASKIHVIRCGVDLDAFRLVPDRCIGETIQLTSVGSLIEKKGHTLLIQACKELKTRGIRFHCVIIGEGSLEPSLRALIQELDVQDEVVLVGRQTQTWVRERLGQTDIFVLACVVTQDGDRDGIPVAIMEAMAMGVPVISTPVTGIPELIQHDTTGLLTPEQDARQLAEAILRLAQDQSLREKLSRQGRKMIEQNYDIQKNVNQLLAVFQQLGERREKGASGLVERKADIT